MKRILCRPCAVHIGAVFPVKQLPSKAEKSTCQECQKRRFCNEYEIGKAVKK